MTDEPVEFVDYIFDRYAYLGLQESASRSEIEAEIRKRKAENHPDRLSNVGEDLKLKAQENWRRVEQCEAVLLNDEMRPLYDKRLNEFRGKKPGLISKSGNPVVSLDREYVDISFLTSGNELDLTRLKEQATIITGHNSKDFDRSQRLYEKTPDDQDFVDIYRTALQKKLTYLEIFEKYLWAAAGISGDSFTESGVTIMDPALVREAVIGQIEHVRENVIPSFVQQRSDLLALGYEQNPLLLLTHDGATPAAFQAVSTELLATVQTAQSRFEALSEAIKDNATERGKTLENLLDLSPFEIIHSVDAERVSVYLIVDKTESNSLDAGRVVGIMKYHEVKMDIEYVKHEMGFDDLRKLPRDETIAVVLLNRHVGQPLLDFGYAYKRVLRSFGKDQELTVKVSDDSSAERPQRVRTPETTSEAPEA